MSEVTRRKAIQQLAGGSVLASAGVVAATAAAPAPTPVPDAPGTPTDPAILRLDGNPPPPTSPIALAKVSRCRSWDHCVYLDAGPGLRGYTQLTASGFAIAAAAQASGRRIAFRHHGHEPHWADGIGRFTGVAIAFDRRDFADDVVTPTGDLA